MRARRTRRAGKVPAVLYGHGKEPEPRHAARPASSMLALKTAAPTRCSPSRSTAPGQLALPKAIQRDPITRHLEHVDLLLVRRGEKVTVDVPVHADRRGRPGHPGRPASTTPSRSRPRPPTSRTTSRSSIEGLEAGTQVTAGDVDAAGRRRRWSPTRSADRRVDHRRPDRRAARGELPRSRLADEAEAEVGETTEGAEGADAAEGAETTEARAEA